ncbi:MAG: GNAT family N-acetyltransferase [Desulfatibacillaceae bacterium]|nr:GNAT family N-acetyltransferase [Desulfatibacillaceae bacterium]
MEIIFIEKPTSRQAAAIIGLYRDAGWWRAGADDEDSLARLIKGSFLFALAVEDGLVVGMGRAISDGASDAYIQDVTVRNDCRGKGIGSLIIKSLVKQLLEHNILWVGLIAEKGSHPFYKALGFLPMPDSVPMKFAHEA